MGNGTDATTAYDANGNIKAMTQYGWKLGVSTTTPIDNLTYNYSLNTNRLLNVIDANNVADTKLGDFRTSALSPNQTKNASTVDYTYDGNGNLKKDLNKDIGTASIEDIVYNYLNLPSSITVRTTGGAIKGTIAYSYDAAGNKLEKRVTEGTALTVTIYLGGAVYEAKGTVSVPGADALQFISHEEGRMRVDVTNATTPNPYDYFIKDHLGNVRMVLTDEYKQNVYPAATMETATINNEETIYDNLLNTQVNKPNWFSDPLYSTNAKVARVKNASGIQKIGPNILLKVMAGDSYSLRVASGWKSNSSASNSSTNVLNDLFNLLTAGIPNNSYGKITQAELQNSSSGLNTALTNFLSSQTTSGTKPKAYINWILLDEQFKIVTASSGFEQVGSSNTTTIHVKTNVSITKNGYLYIYTSNEATNIDVFFDNLQVTHIRGTLISEETFYPYGLSMFGISSRALNFGDPENKKNKFQDQEFNSDLGVNYYEFRYRNHDPQIGRFIQIDPLATKYSYNSTYAFSENRVIDGKELEGLEWTSIKDDKGVTISRQLTVSITNSSKLSDKQLNKLVESLKSNFSKTYGSDGAKAELIISDKSTFKVEIGAQKSTATTDAEGNDAKNFQGGITSKLGETQDNSFDVTASVDGEKRANSNIARSFNHEAGHSAGLRHPFDPNQELTDIKQGEPKVKTSTIKNNLMNSDANKDNPSSTGKALLKSQFRSMDKLIQSQQPKKTEE